MPDSRSEQAKVTVVTLLYQPVALGKEERDADMVGGILSEGVDTRDNL